MRYLQAFSIRIYNYVGLTPASEELRKLRAEGNLEAQADDDEEEKTKSSDDEHYESLNGGGETKNNLGLDWNVLHQYK